MRNIFEIKIKFWYNNLVFWIFFIGILRLVVIFLMVLFFLEMISIFLAMVLVVMG